MSTSTVPENGQTVHIGLDFDNTVVTYDDLFHRAACERGLIDGVVRRHKKDVRDSIRRVEDGERKWTELQGIVYALRMDEAEEAPGVEAFLDAALARGVRVSIISHKTVYPAIGPRVSLRTAARRWLRKRGFTSRFGIDPGDIHFLGTLPRKLSLIRTAGCTHFVDDLVEVLGHARFPAGVERILYAPGGWHDLPPGVVPCASWAAIERRLFG
jgi:hypothetical protein